MRLAIIPVLLVCVTMPVALAQSSNDHLYVSAESTTFGNSIAGSMIVEVIVSDPLRLDIGGQTPKPDVTIDGDRLAMVQRGDGSWAAYFADADSARLADEIVAGRTHGQGPDFGFFCSSNTEQSVLGIDVSSTEGVAVPTEWAGSVDGTDAMSPCTGSPPEGSKTNNVLRDARQPTPDSGVADAAWPLIQLFDLDDTVEISYGRHTGAESVTLHYGEIAGVSMKFDRNVYPFGAEIILDLYDNQLNQDPTSRDSWSFKVSRPHATFYMAFDEDGGDAAHDTTSLVDMVPHLERLGFENNGILSLSDNPVTTIRTSSHQPVLSITDGSASYDDVVTLLETRPNSGIFTSYDGENSMLGAGSDSSRNAVANFAYNDVNTSILFGTSSPSLEVTSVLEPGDAIVVRLEDASQNTDSETREILDISSASAGIPVLRLGSPATLASSAEVVFHAANSTDAYRPSVHVDQNAHMLLLRTQQAPSNFALGSLSIDLGISSHDLADLLIDSTHSSSTGTNWLNYDLRSLARLGADPADISAALSIGPGDLAPIHILDASSGQGLARIGDDIIRSLNSKSGPLHLTLDMGQPVPLPAVDETYPIAADFVSFGVRDGSYINNAIYRFELEETSKDSGVFEGTVGYVVPNQLNMDDPGLIESLQFTGSDIRFLTGGKISASDIMISYPDNSGTRTVQQSVPVFGGPSTPETVTHTGSVGIQGEFGINRDVTITLIDPDLDMDSDVIDVYRVVDDPTSPYVDTVGHAQDGWLLEVLIKGTRYQRCLISDQIHGGLGSTGFVMIETARDSGVFQGSFKIPQWICSSDGTSLVSPAGGSIVARYNDFADSLGDSTVTTSLTQHSAWLPPQLGSSTLEAPPPGQTASVTIQGIVPGHLSGSAVEITVTDPAGMDYILQLTPSKQGIYSGSITVPPSILLGTYAVHVEYLGATLGDLSLTVTEERLPYWMKDLAEEWSAGNVPDVEFVAGLEHLAMRGVLSDISPSVHEMPSWVRVLAGWWSTGHVTDDAFVASVEYLITTGLIGS